MYTIITIAIAVVALIVGAAVTFIVMNSNITRHSAEITRLTAECKAKEREIEVLKDSHAQALAAVKEQFAEQLRTVKEQCAEQLRTAKEEIKNIGKVVMEEESARLKERNSESLSSITNPLKEAIGAMQKAINDSAKDSAAQAAAFRNQMEAMAKSNKEVGERAASLANVLRRDNATIGAMGEVILSELLTSQGLKKGVHYDVQTVLRDSESGQNLRPDVILHYPQGQDAIIDSKVSISAYQRYVNATTDDDRRRFLSEHLQSIRRHVKELSGKDYSKYIEKPRTAVDFVIMFVPFESALQVALAADPTLWSDAFEQKVFITGEQNLAGILHIIHVAWVENTRTENYEKVFKLAEQLLDRLGAFIERYEEVGKAIKKCNTAYEDSSQKLLTGNQSVVKKGRELVAIGAKENAKRRIPEPEPDLNLLSSSEG